MGRGRRQRDEGDDDGGAAVREPRRPNGPAPRSGAGAAPIPAPVQQVWLPAEPEPRDPGSTGDRDGVNVP